MLSEMIMGNTFGITYYVLELDQAFHMPLSIYHYHFHSSDKETEAQRY